MADQIPFEAANDPTYKKYVLTCTTRFYEKVVEGKERKMVLLVPEENDEMHRFLNAWCPTTQGEKHELAAYIGAPAHTPARCAVFMGHDEKCERPYLFVMSKGVEDILVKYKEGLRLIVTTLPANEDSEADNTEASEGNFEVL